MENQPAAPPSDLGRALPNLVSVVIPTFNRAYCIGKTIASLQAQTHRAWEAVIIDDGSTDETAELIAALMRADSRITYFRQANQGVSAARNTGLRRSRGDFVAFLDSDDTWVPWKLEAQVAVLCALPEVGMVWSDMAANDDTGRILAPRYLRTMYRAHSIVSVERIFGQHATLRDFAPSLGELEPECAAAAVHWGDAYSAMLYGSLVHTSTVLLRRERAQRAGFFNEQFRTAEDYDFHMRTCREGAVAFLDAATTGYRVDGGIDQLSSDRYGAEAARNGLATREMALARDPDRFRLPRSELNGIFARAQAMLALELFEEGSYRQARTHFWRSLRLKPRQSRLFAKAALSIAPEALIRRVLALRRMRRSSHAQS